MEGTMVVHCRTDQEKVPLRPSLQEERRRHAKLPREGNRQIWSTELASGLPDSGYGSKLPHRPLTVRRILGNFPFSDSTPFRCHFSVKSQSGKRSFQISPTSFYSSGPLRYFLFYANLTCVEFLVYSIRTPMDQFTVIPPWNKYCNPLASTRNNVDPESISCIHTVPAGQAYRYLDPGEVQTSATSRTEKNTVRRKQTLTMFCFLCHVHTNIFSP